MSKLNISNLTSVMALMLCVQTTWAFDTDTPDPIYTLDTPGSIFDIHIVDAPGGRSYVTACGKGVHAGTGGRGGDLDAIEISGDITDLETGFAGAALADIYPNPLRSTSTVGFTLDRSAKISLNVYDLSGRRVRELDRGSRTEGRHELLWSGDDSHGHPLPAGVYFLRLENGNSTSSRKIVLID